MRPIDADELMEHVYRDKLDSRELIADMVKNAPTIEPERKGKWERILIKDVLGFNTRFSCSECYSIDYCTSPFCRMCGAKMIDI